MALRGSEARKEKTLKSPLVHHQGTTNETDRPPMTDNPDAGKARLSVTVAKATDTLLGSALLKDITG